MKVSYQKTEYYFTFTVNTINNIKKNNISLSIQNYDMYLGVYAKFGGYNFKKNLPNKELQLCSSFCLSPHNFKRLNMTSFFTQSAFITVLQKKFLTCFHCSCFLNC